MDNQTKPPVEMNAAGEIVAALEERPLLAIGLALMPEDVFLEWAREVQHILIRRAVRSLAMSRVKGTR